MSYEYTLLQASQPIRARRVVISAFCVKEEQRYDYVCDEYFLGHVTDKTLYDAMPELQQSGITLKLAYVIQPTITGVLPEVEGLNWHLKHDSERLQSRMGHKLRPPIVPFVPTV